MKQVAVVLGMGLLCSAFAAAAGEKKSIEERLAATPGMVDAASKVPGLKVDLKYSTKDNFIGKDVYGEWERGYRQAEAGAMLAKAAEELKRVRPELSLLAYDCVRPVSVQKQMWDVVKGTKQQGYVANPNSKTGSMHNYGCAVDLTLADADGKAVDMGTPFDFFGAAAQPRHELSLLRQGKLTEAQVANRLLLRYVMTAAGFQPISNEWWHFNCASPGATVRKYKKVP